ncbi:MULTISPECIES: TetR/AcrR family transcriptional regulator [Paenibacillus]|uniref:TetR/AcrR family transcriptional regulator n=1 Tax=Paenibacillus TaxID=44249 RepID=UPI0006D276CB|nr:TetR-like C-terminal domain-containing protein [Paenibacillus sp. tmac-D7]
MSPRMGLDLPAILQAATEIADQQGLENVSLAGLANKLDVRSPSLYNHVNGLPGLRKKMAVYGIGLLTADMRHAAVGRSGDEALRAIARAYVSFVRKHPGLYEATLRAPEADDEDHRRESEALVALVVRVLDVYEYQGEDVYYVVRCFRSMLHGFASLEQQGGFGMPLGLDDTLELLIDAFLAGMRVLKQQRVSGLTKPDAWSERAGDAR